MFKSIKPRQVFILSVACVLMLCGFSKSEAGPTSLSDSSAFLNEEFGFVPKDIPGATVLTPPGTAWSLACDEKSKMIVMGSTDAISISTDQGKNFDFRNRAGIYGWVRDIAFGDLGLYVSTTDDLFVSKDGGINFQTISIPGRLKHGSYVPKLFVNGKMIFFIDEAKQLFISRDGGKNFNKPDLFKNLEIVAMDVNNNFVAIISSKAVGFSGNTYISTDGGQNFTLLTETLYGTPEHLLIRFPYIFFHTSSGFQRFKFSDEIQLKIEENKYFNISSRNVSNIHEIDGTLFVETKSEPSPDDISMEKLLVAKTNANSEEDFVEHSFHKLDKSPHHIRGFCKLNGYVYVNSYGIMYRANTSQGPYSQVSRNDELTGELIETTFAKGNLIFVGTGKGFFRSEDGGKSFIKTMDADVTKIRVEGDTVAVLTDSSSTDHARLYVSTNAGIKFNEIIVPEVSYYYFNDVGIFNGVLYILTSEGSYTSSDAGKTLEPIKIVNEKGLTLTTVGSDGTRVFTIGYSLQKNSNPNLDSDTVWFFWYTADNAQSFTEIKSLKLNDHGQYSNGRIQAMGSAIYVLKGNYLYTSKDSGATFNTTFVYGIKDFVVTEVGLYAIFDHRYSPTLSFLKRSDDDGATFKEVRIPILDKESYSAGNSIFADDSNLYIGTSNGLLRNNIALTPSTPPPEPVATIPNSQLKCSLIVDEKSEPYKRMRADINTWNSYLYEIESKGWTLNNSNAVLKAIFSVGAVASSDAHQYCGLKAESLFRCDAKTYLAYETSGMSIGTKAVGTETATGCGSADACATNLNNSVNLPSSWELEICKIQ